MSILIIAELEKAKQELLNQIEAIDTTIGVLRAKLPKEVTPIADNVTIVHSNGVRKPASKPKSKAVRNSVNKGAKSGTANTDIILKAIEDAGMFIKRSEIANRVSAHSLSADSIRFAITYLKKTKVIVPYHVSSLNSDTVWGKSDWMIDGKIKEEYLNNEAA